jgi:hypothetical protein
VPGPGVAIDPLVPQKRTLMGPRFPCVSFPKDDPNHYAVYRMFIIARFCASPFPDALVETSRQRPSPAPEISGRILLYALGVPVSAAPAFLPNMPFPARNGIRLYSVGMENGLCGGFSSGPTPSRLRPDLYVGLIAGVPFVDVLNTMLDETLPLTLPEWPEWGDPIRDAAAFRTILAYSTYENVRVQSYPAILALAGLTDPRVLYWEPAKWIARLRCLRTGDNLIALRTNLNAGHAGAAGRFDRLTEVALAYAFAIKVADAVRRGKIVKSGFCSACIVTAAERRDCLAGHIGFEPAYPSARYLIGIA